MMNSSVWISTAYIQSPQQMETFVALLTFAESRADFESRIESFLQKHRIICHPHLAPIPLTLFFQRHGRLGLFHYAQQLFENEVKVIEIEKMAGSEPSEKTDYLLRHKIYAVVPLDPLQLDCHPQKIAPDEILKLLWQNEPIQPNLFEQSADDFIEPVFKKPIVDSAQQERDKQLFGELLPPLKTYIVLDSNKVKYFEPERLPNNARNLFQGEFGEKTQKIGPYLIEIFPELQRNDNVAGFFTQKHEIFTKYNWDDEQGIFIHSYYDFEKVYQHLRHFAMQQDENGKWFFFRFYDPRVLRNYLETIAVIPSKLSKFFCDGKRIIYAFGSGFDDSFYYYQLKTLPEDTIPSPIKLTKYEFNGLKRQKWLRKREKTFTEIITENASLWEKDPNFPHRTIFTYLDEAFEKNYPTGKSVSLYAVAKISATIMEKLKQFEQLEYQLENQHYSREEQAAVLYNQFVKREKE
ncbi:DUF4123 domain-containing protein [Rodentibacter pneumotropicus]|nr:DUF4123 domain-containing protein [Rodentibacter pneumotropicus]THA04809.1 DUF4123 domain-containing protein [Rodentibacter pneumotropicus]THA09628.1 DUF4123 domain-containing protein [Rodentibacter pneumotropicus]